MFMPNFVTKFRRDLAVRRIVANGKRLDKVKASRMAIDGSYEHTFVDADYLDNQIDRLERSIERDKGFIRKTA